MRMIHITMIILGEYDDDDGDDNDNDDDENNLGFLGDVDGDDDYARGTEEGKTVNVHSVSLFLSCSNVKSVWSQSLLLDRHACDNFSALLLFDSLLINIHLFSGVAGWVNLLDCRSSKVGTSVAHGDDEDDEEWVVMMMKMNMTRRGRNNLSYLLLLQEEQCTTKRATSDRKHQGM